MNSIRTKPLLIFVLAVIVIGAAARLNPWNDSLEGSLKEIWYRLHMQSRSETRITVVEIDDATLSQYSPQIPLPRDQIALALDYLAGPAGGARLVVLDLYFEGDDPYDPLNDSVLQLVLNQYRGQVVLGVFLPQPTSYESASTMATAMLPETGHHLAGLQLPDFSSGVPPLVRFLEAGETYGHVDIYQNKSQVITELPMFIRSRGVTVGAISLEAARLLLGLSPSDVQYDAAGWLQLGTHRVPLEPDGTYHIRYFRNTPGYKRYSLLDLLAGFESGALQPGLFKGQVVIIGVNSPTHYPREISFTPGGAARPSVYIHADVISNLLSDYHLVTAGKRIALSLLVVVLGLFVVVQFLGSWLIRLSISTTIVLAALLADFICFHSGIVLEIVPAVTSGLILATVTALGVFREQTQIIDEQSRQVYTLGARERQLSHLEGELRVARAIQEHLLPQQLPKVAGYQIFGINVPAQSVSGDFYDVVPLPDGDVLVTLGDVSGKGISASLLMAATQAIIRSECARLSRSQLSLTDLSNAVNQLLCATTDSSRFVTLVLIQLNPATREVRMVNAGHPNPIAVSRQAVPTCIEGGNPPMGILGAWRYTDSAVTLHPGEKIVVVSDGVAEATNADGEMYGEERFRAQVQRSSQGAAQEIATALVKDVREYSGEVLSDDLTVVVMAAE